MAGLNLRLGAGGQVGTVGNVTQGGASYPGAPTVTAAAFGPGYTQTGSPSMAATLFPNDPFGIALWAGFAALAGLLFIRYTLPA